MGESPTTDDTPMEVTFDAVWEQYQRVWAMIWPWERAAARTVALMVPAVVLLVYGLSQLTFASGCLAGAMFVVACLLLARLRRLRGMARQSWQAHFSQPVTYTYRFDRELVRIQTAETARELAWGYVLDVRSDDLVVSLALKLPTVCWVPRASLTDQQLARILAWWTAGRARSAETVSATGTAKAPATAGGGVVGALRRSPALGVGLAALVGAALVAATPVVKDRLTPSAARPCSLLDTAQVSAAMGQPVPATPVQDTGLVPGSGGCTWALADGGAVSVTSIQDGGTLYRSTRSIEPGFGPPRTDIPGLDGWSSDADGGQTANVLAGTTFLTIRAHGQSVQPPPGAAVQLARIAADRAG